MKTILVPADFSTNSENALLYAVELNKKIKGKIILYNSYYIPVPATDIPVAGINYEGLRKASVDSLNKLKTKYEKLFPAMQFESKVEEGIFEDEFISREKKSKCDFVIMGTKGASGIGELIGTNAARVISDSICPVIAIPENAKMKGLQKIVFAANYGEDDFRNIFDLIDIARLFDSEVILLHVKDEANNNAMEYAELEGFRNHVINESKYPKISLKLLEDEDVYEGLNFYLEEIKADMLAISMRNRSFIQKLFNRSLTKKMVYHSHLPVLAFHTSV